MTPDEQKKLLHDLRNPLNVIAGYAEMLEEETDLETIHRYAKTIRRAAAEMETLLVNSKT